jgi:hypothetical protein
VVSGAQEPCQVINQYINVIPAGKQEIENVEMEDTDEDEPPPKSEEDNSSDDETYVDEDVPDDEKLHCEASDEDDVTATEGGTEGNIHPRSGRTVQIPDRY